MMVESLWTQPTAGEIVAFEADFKWALAEIDQLREQMRQDDREIKRSPAQIEAHLAGIAAILKALSADTGNDRVTPVSNTPPP